MFFKLRGTELSLSGKVAKMCPGSIRKRPNVLKPQLNYSAFRNSFKMFQVGVIQLFRLKLVPQSYQKLHYRSWNLFNVIPLTRAYNCVPEEWGPVHVRAIAEDPCSVMTMGNGSFKGSRPLVTSIAFLLSHVCLRALTLSLTGLPLL